MPFVRLLISTAAAVCSITATVFAQAPATGVISTLAGDGTAGYLGDGTPATSARLNLPFGVAVDAAGNVYIADFYNHRVRKVTAATGVITTVAGSGVAGFLGDGGAATAARLYNPIGVALDGAGNLHIADYNNNRIRKVDLGTGVISTVAGSGSAGYGGDGGAATAALLYRPSAVAFDAGETMYIADEYNHRIRTVAAGTGIITTIAGNGIAGYDGDGGPAPNARLNYPLGVAVDSAGNVYVADYYNHRIRKVTAATGIITTAAGTGTAGFLGENSLATTARFYYPASVAVDAAGNVYIADQYTYRVRKLTVATGLLATVAGSGNPLFGGNGGQATAAQLNEPTGVALDTAGNLYIADSVNARIRKVSVPTPTLQITTLAGNGTAGYDGDGGLAPNARLDYPRGTAVDSAGNVYVADYYNHRIRKITAATGVITTIAGTGTPGFAGEGGLATAARLYYPEGVAVDYVGNVYIADTYNHRIRKITVATGIISTMAGSGTVGSGGDGSLATAAQLNTPTAIAIDAAGSLYIADHYNHRIRKVQAGTGIISTIAGTGTAGYLGDGTPATTANLHYPYGVAVDGVGNVYIADYGNHRVRKVAAATGIITTFAGNGSAGFLGEAVQATEARLYNPTHLATDTAGNVYIADYQNGRIRKVTAATGFLNTVAGSGTLGFGGDGGAATASQLYYPIGVAVDAGGNLYIGDYYNHRVRRVASPLGTPTNLTATAVSPTSIRLNWAAATGAVTYTIKRGTASGGEVVVASGVTSPTFLDTPLATDATYYYVVVAVSYATESASSNEASVRLVSTSVPADFDHDRRADIAIYRPLQGRWYVLRSSSNYTTYGSFNWGATTDLPVAGDYDGDGTIDPAVYRPSSGTWYVLLSSTGYANYSSFNWGTPTDVPVPGDYDGDGKTDIAIFRASASAWYILLSGSSYASTTLYWGTATDLPVPADYDGDRKTDIAIYRPASGTWYALLSSTGYASYAAYGWGSASDIPVPGDYDADGRADVAVYRPSTGTWWIYRSSNSTIAAYQWGTATDVPVPGDFDGDGRVDIAIFRPSTGTWFIKLSSTGYASYININWGVNNDIPILGRQ